MSDEKFIKIAIEEAKKGDSPYGAVLVRGGKVISKAFNTNKYDSTAHAEVNVIRKACEILKTKHLGGCILYCSCEPCPMCFSAAWWAKISRIVYSSYGDDIPKEKRRININIMDLNQKSGNKIDIKGGVLREEGRMLFEYLK